MGNIFISKDMYQKIIYYLKSEKKSIKTIEVVCVDSKTILIIEYEY